MKPTHDRIDELHRIGCIACKLSLRSSQAQIHHLNEGGHAGQKRRGADFTIPLCPWHHQGIPPDPMTVKQAEAYYGPSLAYAPRAFREKYGSDNKLLGQVNKIISERRKP
jgi:hypothetical protein